MSTYPLNDEPRSHLRLVDPKAPYDATPEPKQYRVSRSTELERTIMGTLGASAFAVYAFIDGYADTNRQAWPSIETIMEGAMLSESTVKRAIKALIAGGWLTKEPRKNKFGFVRGVTYTVIHHMTPSDGEGATEGFTQGVTTEVKCTPRGNTKVTPKVNPRSGGRTRAAALPADFTLTDERLAYATGKGLSREMAALEFEKFIAYWREKGGTKKDWHAAWQRWVLNEVKWATERQAKQGGQNQGQRVTADLFATYGTSMGEDELNRRCADLLADAEGQP